jgi:hypothetical protein
MPDMTMQWGFWDILKAALLILVADVLFVLAFAMVVRCAERYHTWKRKYFSPR